MSKYIITGTTDQSNGTEGVVLEKDGDGNVTKEISTTRPTDLTKSELAQVRGLGITVEKISASDAAALEADQASTVVGSDTSGAAPTFGND